MRNILSNQKGQAIVEFSLVFVFFIAFLLAIVIHGSWMYNKFNTDRAARMAAIHLATTNNSVQAVQIAKEHLDNTIIFADIEDINSYWNGDSTVGKVHIEMETFFPGMAKLINPNNPTWSGTVDIVKEVEAPGEHKYTHSQGYN